MMKNKNTVRTLDNFNAYQEYKKNLSYINMIYGEFVPKFLSQLTQQPREDYQRYYKQGARYAVNGQLFIAPCTFLICESKQHLNKININILGKVIGNGSFGTVVQTDYKIIIIKVSSSYYISQVIRPENDTKVVKIQQLTAATKREYEIQRRFEQYKTRKQIISKVKIGHIEQELSFLLMKKFKGQSLRNFIKQGQHIRLTNAQRLQIVIKLIKALKRINNQGIIHRDVKPANVMVSIDPIEVEIIDFGLSKKNNDHSHKNDDGTFNYSAPEVLAGKNYDSKIDVFSLGLTIAQLFGANQTQVFVTKSQRLYKLIFEIKNYNNQCDKYKASRILDWSGYDNKKAFVLGKVTTANLLGHDMLSNKIKETSSSSTRSSELKEAIINNSVSDSFISFNSQGFEVSKTAECSSNHCLRDKQILEEKLVLLEEEASELRQSISTLQPQDRIDSDCINDPDVKKLIFNMIEPNPEKRISIDDAYRFTKRNAFIDNAMNKQHAAFHSDVLKQIETNRSSFKNDSKRAYPSLFNQPQKITHGMVQEQANALTYPTP